MLRCDRAKIGLLDFPMEEMSFSNLKVDSIQWRGQQNLISS